MASAQTTTLSIHGAPLDADPARLGELVPSDAEPAGALRDRLDADGYLYLPGFFAREDVLAARAEIVERIAQAGGLVAGTDPSDAVARPGAALDLGMSNRELARDNAPLQALLYRGRLIALHEQLLGGPVRPFDMTWMRVTAPGSGTQAHTDIVFMGRGSHDLLTCWVPYGDVPVAMGGLAILEGSHRSSFIREQYARLDVDSHCVNHGEGPGQGHVDPTLDEDPDALRERLGGRWLTTDFAAGDLLVFGMFTAHAGLDNRTDRWRLSSDSRYQLASEPIDERWIGEEPAGHGPHASRGLIC